MTYDGVDKTFHLADEEFFQSLKQKCVFINASRGAVVDSVALKATIKAGKLKAVALDVWENEPNIDTELLEMVDISTPHIAGYSLDGKITGMIMIYKAVCDFFGLQAKYDVKDFLPEPVMPQLIINPDSGDEQEVLRNAVQKIYNVTEDDRKLREIIEESAKKRGKFFDGLRKNYPVRREFQNTQVILQSSCQSLAEKLAGIGFRVANEQKQ